MTRRSLASLRHISSNNMARFSVVLYITMVLVIVQSSSAEETCQSLGGTCKGSLWSNVKCDGQGRYPMAGCGASIVCCLPPKQATVKTCAASCGNCLTTKTTPFCAGYKVPASDCNGPSEFCCVRAWIGPCPSSP
ncbi:uncharacterized protein LOC124271835 [Haliotis rubra]|uniref:uncharacterized protein LOC124271835 n=1 Tax=Haliotis rubra TaxID=36100 RepID=UPI001EE5E6BA|nr:uncharacterized protein LOC124271835 [Haliotis rubra]